MSKKALAEALGISSRSLYAYEKGEHEPSEENLDLIASVLSFPKHFFLGEDLAEPSPEGASFRSLSRMTAAQRDTALSAGALGFALMGWANERFILPEPDIPDLRQLSPARAAEAIRHEWGLGSKPISDLIGLLESRGVRVLSLVQECQEVDAFSVWNASVPFIFLNTQKSAERSRFDCAHELGHLVLHQHGSPTGKNVELEANEFAANLLMPQEGVHATARLVPSLTSVLTEKQRWKVSAMAYARRLKDTGLIEDWHYRQLCIQMSQRGYRSHEPMPTKRESSQVLTKVFGFLRDKKSMRNLASDIGVTLSELNRLAFGLAIVGLDGEAAASPSTSTSKSARHHLRVVKDET